MGDKNALPILLSKGALRGSYIFFKVGWAPAVRQVVKALFTVC